MTSECRAKNPLLVEYGKPSEMREDVHAMSLLTQTVGCTEKEVVMSNRSSASTENGHGESTLYRSLMINVLGYHDKEEEAWVALGLEMDIRGYGSSFEEAAEDLGELVIMQIGFAQAKNQPELLLHPAEPVWWQLFEQMRQARFSDMARGRSTGSLGHHAEYEIAGMPLPSPQAIAQRRAQFDRLNG